MQQFNGLRKVKITKDSEGQEYLVGTMGDTFMMWFLPLLRLILTGRDGYVCILKNDLSMPTIGLFLNLYTEEAKDPTGLSVHGKAIVSDVGITMAYVYSVEYLLEDFLRVLNPAPHIPTQLLSKLSIHYRFSRFPLISMYSLC